MIDDEFPVIKVKLRFTEATVVFPSGRITFMSFRALLRLIWDMRGEAEFKVEK